MRGEEMDKPQSWPASVSTTMQPQVYVTVDEQEWGVLDAQGILADRGVAHVIPVAAKNVPPVEEGSDL